MATSNNIAAFEADLENDYNQLGQHLMNQRPTLFQYATKPFHQNPELMCREVNCHPDVIRRGDPQISLESPLALLGTDGGFGIDYCFQITTLKLDLHPRNSLQEQVRIDPTQPQHLALVAQICGGILCPATSSPEHAATVMRPEGFTLDLFATATSRWLGAASHRQLAIAVGDIEIADVNPDGLSSGLECYIATTLRVGIVPRIQLALESMAYELGQLATLALAPTPLAAGRSAKPLTTNGALNHCLNASLG